jgi:peptidoglycan/xylan/chitin deacetylase (PgdA/CDA1 family)
VVVRRPKLLRLALWTTSAAGLAAGAAALIGAPPSLGLALSGLALEATLATLGVLVPSVGVFGEVFSRGPLERAEVALTFDDGPNPETTPRVLALLAEHGARATFFVVGEKALAHPALLRAIAEAGHAVGVHGHVHDPLYALRSARFVERDIERACAAVERALGAPPVLFRPPIGFVSGAVAVAAERRGLILVGWSARTLDGWRGTPPARVLTRATAALENGAILVLHDAAERDDRVPASLAVLPDLLARLTARGLRAVTVDALRRDLRSSARADLDRRE